MVVVLCARKIAVAVAEAQGCPMVALQRHVDRRALELGFGDGNC